MLLLLLPCHSRHDAAELEPASVLVRWLSPLINPEITPCLGEQPGHVWLEEACAL